MVTGRKAETEENGNVLHRGIATRAFERRFQLADHVRAVEARTKNGLLHIDLVREVPEALKPRKIEIASAQGHRDPAPRPDRACGARRHDGSRPAEQSAGRFLLTGCGARRRSRRRRAR